MPIEGQCLGCFSALNYSLIPPNLELNESLDEFYGKYAEKQTAEEWIDNNDFNTAVGGDVVSTWMAK